MLGKFKKVDNPLTIIAMFAGITEVASAIALPILDTTTQQMFVWFLILFPFALVSAFFVTLNFNPRVLYAPGDYRDEKHFLAALSLSQERPQVTVTSPEDIPSPIVEPVEATRSDSPKSNLSGLTKDELDCANAMFYEFTDEARGFFEAELITGYSFGYEGDGLFLLTLMLDPDELTGPNIESRIIRAVASPSNGAELHVAGHNIRCSNPKQFAKLLATELQQRIQHRKKTEAKSGKDEPNKAIDGD